MPVSDPIVAKVRLLLQQGRMTVTGREVHNGIDSWAISLKPGVGRPVWTLWVSAADGRPLELRDPGRDGSEQPQVIRWPTYEVLPDSHASQLLTLTGARPSAHWITAPRRPRLPSSASWRTSPDHEARAPNAEVQGRLNSRRFPPASSGRPPDPAQA